jgi:hypothetical protein
LLLVGSSQRRRRDGDPRRRPQIALDRVIAEYATLPPAATRRFLIQVRR